MNNGKCGKGWEPGFGGKCVRSKKKRTIGQAIGGVASKVFPHKNIDKSYKWNSKKTGKIAAAAGIATVGGGLLGLVSSSRRGQKGGRDEWDRLVNSSEKQKERVSRKLRTDRKSPGTPPPPGTPPWEEVAEQMMRDWGIEDPWGKGKRKDSLRFRGDRKSPGKCGKGWESGTGGKCVRPRPKSDRLPTSESKKDPAPPDSPGKGVNPRLVMSGIGLTAGLGLMAYGAYDAHKTNQYIRKQVDERMRQSASRDWWTGGAGAGSGTGGDASGTQDARSEYQRRYEEARRRAQERERTGQQAPPSGRNSGPSFSRAEAQSWWAKNGSGGAATRQSMRKARKAAWAKVHPDAVQDPKEKARRTAQFRKVSDEFENAARAMGINLDSVIRLRRDRQSRGGCGKGWTGGVKGKCARAKRKWTTLGLKKREVSELDGFLSKYERRQDSEERLDAPFGGKCGRGWEPGPGGKCVRKRRRGMALNEKIGMGLAATGVGLVGLSAFGAYRENKQREARVKAAQNAGVSASKIQPPKIKLSDNLKDRAKKLTDEFPEMLERERQSIKERSRQSQGVSPQSPSNETPVLPTRKESPADRAYARHQEALEKKRSRHPARKKQFQRTQGRGLKNKARSQMRSKGLLRIESPDATRYTVKARRNAQRWAEEDRLRAQDGERKDSLRFRGDRKSPGKCGKGWEPGPGGKCVRSRGGISKKLLAGAAIAGAAGTLGGVAYLTPKIGRVYNERNQLRKQNSQQRQENQRISEQKRAAEVRAAGAEERAKIQQGIVSAKDYQIRDRESTIRSRDAAIRDREEKIRSAERENKAQSEQFASELRKAKAKRARTRPRSTDRTNLGKQQERRRLRKLEREAGVVDAAQKEGKARIALLNRYRSLRRKGMSHGEVRQATESDYEQTGKIIKERKDLEKKVRASLPRRGGRTSVKFVGGSSRFAKPYVGDSMLTQENFDFISQEVSASHGIKIDDVYHLEERRDGVSGIASCGGDFFEFDITSRSVSITDREDLTEAADQRARGALASRGLAYRGDSAFEYLRGMETRLDAPRVGGKCGRGWEPGPGGKCVRSKGRLGMAGKIGLGVAGLAAAGGIAYANRDRIANSQVGQQARKMAGQVKQKASAAYDRAANSKYGQKAQQVAGKIQGKAQAAADRVANSRYGRKAQQVAGQVEGQARSIYRQARGEAGKVKRGIESAVGSGMNRVANSSVGQKAQRVAGRVEGQARSAYRQARGEAGKAKRSVESTVASGMNRVANSKYGRKARTELGRAKRQVQSTVDQGVQMGRRGAQKVKRQVRRVVS